MLTAPFPWFGGKRKVAKVVWDRFGNTHNYVEPFAGSLAVLLGRPSTPQIETINDTNGFLVNFWRAVRWAPEAVAKYCEWPITELDLNAWHNYLAGIIGLDEALRADPRFFDVELAGKWVWGQCCWIGEGFADFNFRQHSKGLTSHGKGVTSRKMQIPNSHGSGIHARKMHAGRTPGCLGKAYRDNLVDRFKELSSRLMNVKMACGDFTRVLTKPFTTFHGLTSIFLDPPYGVKKRTRCYGSHDSRTVAADCRNWCLENQNNKQLRIALCGYEGEHEELLENGWTVHCWSTDGGYSNRGDNDNRHKERIFFSPHCLPERKQLELFAT